MFLMMTADSDLAIASVPQNQGEVQSLAAPGMNAFQKLLLENLPQGVILLSPKMQRLYMNPCAQVLCQELLTVSEDPAALPTVLVEICDQFLGGSPSLPGLFIHEVATPGGGAIRLQVHRLACDAMYFPESGLVANDLLLITLEDCYTRSLQDRWLEQKRYGFTRREAEVWQLIQQQHSYQEIAQRLAISLNTVKTHVKNIYAKRRAKGVLQEVAC